MRDCNAGCAEKHLPANPVWPPQLAVLWNWNEDYLALLVLSCWPSWQTRENRKKNNPFWTSQHQHMCLQRQTAQMHVDSILSCAISALGSGRISHLPYLWVISASLFISSMSPLLKATLSRFLCNPWQNDPFPHLYKWGGVFKWCTLKPKLPQGLVSRMEETTKRHQQLLVLLAQLSSDP